MPNKEKEMKAAYVALGKGFSALLLLIGILVLVGFMFYGSAVIYKELFSINGKWGALEWFLFLWTTRFLARPVARQLHKVVSEKSEKHG